MTIADGFYDQVAQTLEDGRALAAARMDSVCKVFHASGRGALNPVTKKQDPVFVNRATGLACRVGAQKQVSADTTQPADALGVRLVREISVLVTAPTLFAGDFLELTTVGPLTDASLAGVRFRIVDPGYYSQGTARRLKVEVDA